MKEAVPFRAALLRLAEELITGDRNKTYGSPTENFKNIAALLNVQFAHKLKQDFTAADVAVIMMHVKLARMIAEPKYDNWLDVAGYAACGAECQEELNGKVQGT